MTTAPKTAQLSPSEWKAVCLTNIKDLYAFVDSIQAPTREHFAAIDQHLARWGTFMRSWELQCAPAEAKAAPEEAAPEPPKNIPPVDVKPAGKKRGRKSKAELAAIAAAQAQAA